MPFSGITRDPDYRYYNCNIQAPRIKCELLDPDQINDSEIHMMSGLTSYNGIFPLFGNQFTFDSTVLPIMTQKNVSGELTLYLKNDYTNQCNVTTIILIKTDNILTNADFYQRVGNFTSLTTGIVANNLVVNTSPSCFCRWFFRGH